MGNGGHLALVGGTIYRSPDDSPLPDGTVLVQNGTIVAVGPKASVRIPADARVLDCSGLTITAGFWNSHVHFFERKWADAATIPANELARQVEQMLTSHGFTSVFDLGSMWENTRALRDRIERGEVPGPRIRTTGAGLLPPGAMPSDLVLAMMGVMKFPAPEVAGAAQAAAAARKLLDAGVDAIKLFASSPHSPPLPESAIRAAADEAHRAEKPVFVHPNSAADVLTAVRAGVDVIAHTTPQSGAWDAAIIAAMQKRRVAVTPTLQLWKHQKRHDRFSAQEEFANTAVGQLRAWAAAGGTVLFGTDVGAAEYDPTDEYAAMSAAGMTFPRILASLTTTPAERFGDSKRLGRVAPGLEADLVALRGDPAKQVRALGAVELTMRAGKILYRATI